MKPSPERTPGRAGCSLFPVPQSLAQPVGSRAAVAICAFRSSVRGIATTTVTARFNAALVESGRFVVAPSREEAERAGLALGESLSGHTAQDAAARFMFVGTLEDERPEQPPACPAGALMIEIAVVDARSGLVLDVIQARQAITGSPPAVQLDLPVAICIDTVVRELVDRYGTDDR